MPTKPRRYFRAWADERSDARVLELPLREGNAAALNAGLRLAETDIVAVVDADLEPLPDFLLELVRPFADGRVAAAASVPTNAYPESSIAWASLLLLHNRRLAVTRPSQRLLYSLSYDRSLFDRFGRFREDLRAGEDTEFNARFQEHAHTVLAPDAVTAHRYPTELGTMLRDAFRRGRLQAQMQGAIEGRGPQNVRVALGGPRTVLRALVVSGRSPRPERCTLLRAWPLVVAGAVAYTAGVLTASGSPQAE